MIPLLGLALGGSVLAFCLDYLFDTKNNEPTEAVEDPEPAIEDIAPSAPANDEEPAVQPLVDTHFKVAAAALAATVASSIGASPLLAVAGTAGLVWVSIPFWRDAYASLFHEHRVRMSVVDAISLPIAITTGNMVPAAFGYAVAVAGHNLLRRTESNSKQGLLHLYDRVKDQVWRLREEAEPELIAITDLVVGDRIRVSAGEGVPIDGIVEDGYCRVDQQSLTGESLPADKMPGDTIFASTLLLEGRVVIRVERAGEDTVAAQIIRLLAETIDFKSTVQTKGEAFGNAAALPLIALSALAFTFVSPTCALAILYAPLLGTIRIAAPIGMLNHLNQAARQGILVRDGRAMELLASINTFVFDKTGTLTQDRLSLEGIEVVSPWTEDEVLIMAASAENGQSHPIAHAIVNAAQERSLPLCEIDSAQVLLGMGLDVQVAGRRVKVGSERFVKAVQNLPIPPIFNAARMQAAENGFSLAYVVIDDHVAGVFILRTELRPDAQATIDALRARGHQVLILSGDHETPTRMLAKQLGVDGFFAETLPEHKAEVIRNLRTKGHSICFVGDGINDTIALKEANVSVSLNDASRLASDTAQVVLMNNRLGQLMELLDIAARYDSNVKVSIATAAIPSAICIGGALLGFVGVKAAIGLYMVSLGGGAINAIRSGPTTKKNTDMAQES